MESISSFEKEVAGIEAELEGILQIPLKELSGRLSAMVNLPTIRNQIPSCFGELKKIH